MAEVMLDVIYYSQEGEYKNPFGAVQVNETR